MKTILLAALTLAGVVHSATKYPFPYFAQYPNGTKASWSPTAAQTTIQEKFADWKKNYYETCSNGKGARIKWMDYKADGSFGCTQDGGECTVSEGIGYGMLIVVYMDNSVNNTKTMFDNLWKYYKSFPDNKGLMNWKIKGCDNAVETGAATDAELDVALALAMAYKQWGDASYLSDLKTLLGKMWDNEVDGGKLLKPGSQFGSPYNPSYFSLGALKVFAEVDPGHDWNAVASNSIALILKNQNRTTGLNSDWCNNNGDPQNYNNTGTDKFGFDAVRTPWRVALGYLWFGGNSEKAMLTKINTWIRSVAGTGWTKMKAEWKLDGSASASYSNALYKGAFAMTGVVTPADSTWLAAGAKSISSHGMDYYFNDSWQVIYLLTLAGNFQNFWGPVAPVGLEPRTTPSREWTVHTSGGGLQLVGNGSVVAELRDLQGGLVARAQGTDRLQFQRPTGHGMYLVHVLGERPGVIPVVLH